MDFGAFLGALADEPYASVLECEREGRAYA